MDSNMAHYTNQVDEDREGIPWMQFTNGLWDLEDDIGFSDATNTWMQATDGLWGLEDDIDFSDAANTWMQASFGPSGASGLLSPNDHSAVPNIGAFLGHNIENQPRDSAAMESIYAMLSSHSREEDRNSQPNFDPKPTAYGDNDQEPTPNYVFKSRNSEDHPELDHSSDVGNTQEQVEDVQASHPSAHPSIRARKVTGPSLAEWEARYDEIYYWYIEQNCNCETVMDIMKKDGFHASVPMYKRKFDKWHGVKRHGVERNWKKYQPSRESEMPYVQPPARRIGQGPQSQTLASSLNTLREATSNLNSSRGSTVAVSSPRPPYFKLGIPSATSKTTIQALIDATISNAAELYNSYLGLNKWKVEQKCEVEEDGHDKFLVSVATSLRQLESLGPTISFMGIQKAFQMLEKVIGVKRGADCGFFSLPALLLSFIRLIRGKKPEIAESFLWRAFWLAKNKYGSDHYFVQVLENLREMQKTDPDQLFGVICQVYRTCIRVAEERLVDFHLTTLTLWGDFVVYLDGSSINETMLAVDKIKRGIQNSEKENGPRHTYTLELRGLALYMLQSHPIMEIEAEKAALDYLNIVEGIRASAGGQLEGDLATTRKDLIQTLGTFRSGQNDFKKAVKYLEEFLFIEIEDDRDNLALHKLEECYIKLGELEKAKMVRRRRTECSTILLEQDDDTCSRSDNASNEGGSHTEGDDKEDGRSEATAVKNSEESDEENGDEDADASGDVEAEKQLLREQIMELQERLKNLEN